MKKFISLVMSIVMLISITAGVDLSALAGTEHSSSDVASVEFSAARDLYAGLDYLSFGIQADVTFKDGDTFVYDFGYEYEYIGDGDDYLYHTCQNLMDWFGNCFEFEADGDLDTIGTLNVTVVDYLSEKIPYNDSFTINVVENPVDSIEYIGNDITIDSSSAEQRTDEYYDYDKEEWFSKTYNAYEYCECDYDDIRINYKNGDSVIVSEIFSGSGWSFDGLSSSVFIGNAPNPDFRIHANVRHRLEFVSNQVENPWTKGNSYPVTIKYMGVECTYNVNIFDAGTFKDSVESIEFVPVKPLKVIENYNGYLSDSGNYIYSTSLIFNNGDKLLFHMTDGSTVIGEHKQNGDDELYGHFTVVGEGLYSNIESDITFSDNQESKPWTKDGDNYITMKYNGLSCQIPVSVVESSIADITYTPVDDISFPIYTRGFWSSDQYLSENFIYYNMYNYNFFTVGDKVTVADKSGGTCDYVYTQVDDWDYEFRNSDDEILDVYMSFDDEIHIGTNYFTVNVMGKTIDVPFELTSNGKQVESISFVTDREMILRNCYDEGGFNYYYYQSEQLFRDGDVLNVTYEDGETVAFEYRYDPYDIYEFGAFYSDNGEIIDNRTEFISFCDNQYAKHFSPNGDNYLSLVYMGAVTQVPITIKESSDNEEIDVDALDVISAGETKNARIYESGERAYFKFIPEEDGTYSFYSSSSNDTYGYLYDANMQELASNDDDGNGNNFLITYDFIAGETYILCARYLDSEQTGSFNVTLEASNVTSIEFNFAKGNNEIQEFTHGEYDCRWDDDLEDEVSYYCYSLWDIIGYPGNSITINYKDGTSDTYTCKYRNYYFENEDGEYLNISDVYATISQSNCPWTAGNEYSFTIEVMGAKAQEKIKIVGNTIASIDYIRAEQKAIAEGVDYYFSEDYYDTPWISATEGDKLIINDIDGSSKEYIFNKEWDSEYEEWICEYVSKDGNSINYEEVKFNTYRDNGVLTLDVEYANRSTTVNIAEKKAVSVEYIPVSTPIINEADPQKADMYWYINEREEGISVSYWFYSTQVYWGNENGETVILSNIIQAGDTLKITYDNGEVVTYTYNNWSYEYGYRFNGDDGSEFCLCGTHGIQIRDNQYSDHWTAGGNNYFTININGVSSNKIPVQIAENQIDNIEFIPNSEYVLYENESNDYDSNIPEGKLAISYKDGTKKEYSVDRGGYISELRLWLSYLYSDAQNWKLGNDNVLTLYIFGKTTTIPVAIIESPVESISVACNKHYIEDISNAHTTGVPFELTINYNDGTSENVTLCRGDEYKNAYLNIVEIYEVTNSDGSSYVQFLFEYAGASYTLNIPCDKITIESIETKQVKVPELNGVLVDPLCLIDEGTVEFTVTLSNGDKEVFTSDELKSYYGGGSPYDEDEQIHYFGWDYVYVGKYVLKVSYDTTVKGDHHFVDGTDVTFTIGNVSSTLSITTKKEEHSHNYSTAVTEPTCSDSGYTTYICECGDSYVSDYTEVLPHTEIIDAAKAATCTETGLTEGKHCSVCNEVLVAQEIVEKLAHKEVVDSAVEPTCTATGLSEGKHCSVCNDVIVAQTTVKELGHDLGEWIVTAEPTCNNKGTEIRSCSRCDYFETREIAIVNHNYVATVIAPTCTEKGYTTYTCASCGDSYVDNYINATGHQEVAVSAKPATCSSTGLTEGIKCSVCNEVLTAQAVIPKLAHTPEIIPAVPATCSSTGLTEGSKCSACGEIITAQETTAATEHTYVNVVTKATLSKDGKIVPTCSACGAAKTATAIAYPKTITLSATTFTYDGKVKSPKVTVKDNKGKIIAASNYTVSYASGRKNVGKYAVKITFKGNYSGSKTLYFTIVPKDTSISSVTASSKGFTVKWKKQATQTTGYEIQYSTDKNFKKGNKTVTVSKNSTTSKKISKLSAKKKYYVRVRTYKTVKLNDKSTKIYSGWSKVKNVTTKK